MSSPVLSILAAATAAGEAPPAWVQFVPLIAMVFIFWFLILRPQMKRQKEHQAKVAGIKKGDQVLTGAGFVGKVTRVIDEHYAEIEIAQGMKVKALKSTITDVIAPGGAAAND